MQDIAELGGNAFEFRAEFFIVEDSQGNRRVTSKYLGAFFDLICQTLDFAEPGLDQTECLRRRQNLNILNNFMTPVRDFLRLCGERGPAAFHHSELQAEDFFLASSILLSITFVVEQLSALINIQEDFSMVPFLNSKILKDRLASSGWCPHAIATAERRFPSTTVLYYLSTMRHGTANQDHTRCSPEICQRSQLDESTYEQKHAPLVHFSCHFHFFDYN